jgi:hypothetical protein
MCITNGMDDFFSHFLSDIVCLLAISYFLCLHLGSEIIDIIVSVINLHCLYLALVCIFSPLHISSVMEQQASYDCKVIEEFQKSFSNK